MTRRIGVAFSAALLSLTLVATLTSCLSEPLEIFSCYEEESSFFLGRPPLEVCMLVEGGRQAAVSYLWDFGDGSTSSERDVTHTYAMVGEYQVVLTAFHADGSVETDAEWVGVAGEPEAAFTYRPIAVGSFDWLLSWFGSTPQTNEESLTIEFDAAPSYPSDENKAYRPKTLMWQFGDGAQLTKNVPGKHSWFRGTPMLVNHEYSAAGTYEVTLTLIDNLGYSDSLTQTITVGNLDDGDGDDVTEQFTLTSSFWDVEDEGDEEDGCLSVYGVVTNDGPLDAGVELMAIAYAGTTAVGTVSHWAAGTGNITAGTDYAYGFFLCELSVPADQVTDVVVGIADAAIW